MKRIVFGLFLLSLAGTSGAQVLNPVLWSFSSKKIADKTYEVHLTATIQKGWHMYSQHQPADAIANPTEIVFSKNPLIHLEGSTSESGKVELYKDRKLGISANQYKDKVEFVQKVKLKADVKTNIVGSVEFQTCDDKKCLPPAKVDFSIAVK